MHEAEETLTPDERARFEWFLTDYLGIAAVAHAGHYRGDVFSIAHATAQQRAEAFLATRIGAEPT
jgi:hypothetical protein